MAGGSRLLFVVPRKRSTKYHEEGKSLDSSMTTRPPGSYTGLAIAIIVAALIIGSVAYLAFSPTGKTTITVTIPCDASSALHCVVFQQLGACSNPEFWGVPWSVTVGGTTEVQPPGAPPPGPDSGLEGTLDENLTVIAFSLPNGTYSFTVWPPSGYTATPASGTIVIDGANVTVDLTFSD